MTTTTDIIGLSLATTALSAKLREKEIESTGTDPGEALHRIHKDRCDRLPKDARPVGEAPLQAIADAKACTRCKPDIEELQANARAQLDATYVGTTEHPDEVPESVLQHIEQQREEEREQEERADVQVPVDGKSGEIVRVSGPVEVYAGPAAQVHEDGRVLALTPTLYPEVHEDVPLYCPGHNTTHLAKQFRYLDKRGSGAGRPVECRKAQSERLEQNKVRKAEGKAKLPPPRVDAAHVASGA